MHLIRNIFSHTHIVTPLFSVFIMMVGFGSMSLHAHTEAEKAAARYATQTQLSSTLETSQANTAAVKEADSVEVESQSTNGGKPSTVPAPTTRPSSETTYSTIKSNQSNTTPSYYYMSNPRDVPVVDKIPSLLSESDRETLAFIDSLKVQGVRTPTSYRPTKATPEREPYGTYTFLTNTLDNQYIKSIQANKNMPGGFSIAYRAAYGSCYSADNPACVGRIADFPGTAQSIVIDVRSTFPELFSVIKQPDSRGNFYVEFSISPLYEGGVYNQIGGWTDMFMPCSDETIYFRCTM